MIGGSSSPHVRLGDKPSPGSAVVTTFSIARPGGPTTPKRATDEERRAKHREAQRRFVKRKKVRPGVLVEGNMLKGVSMLTKIHLVIDCSDRDVAAEAVGGGAREETRFTAGGGRAGGAGAREPGFGAAARVAEGERTRLTEEHKPACRDGRFPLGFFIAAKYRS